jgi:hypothetical protein
LDLRLHLKKSQELKNYEMIWYLLEHLVCR